MAELKNFILRHEAVKLYRTFLKTIKEAPKDSHGKFAAIPANHSTMQVGDLHYFQRPDVQSKCWTAAVMLRWTHAMFLHSLAQGRCLRLHTMNYSAFQQVN